MFGYCCWPSLAVILWDEHMYNYVVGWSGIPGMAGRSIVGPIGLGITELFGLSREPFPQGYMLAFSP